MNREFRNTDHLVNSVGDVLEANGTLLNALKTELRGEFQNRMYTVQLAKGGPLLVHTDAGLHAPIQRGKELYSGDQVQPTGEIKYTQDASGSENGRSTNAPRNHIWFEVRHPRGGTGWVSADYLVGDILNWKTPPPQMRAPQPVPQPQVTNRPSKDQLRKLRRERNMWRRRALEDDEPDSQVEPRTATSPELDPRIVAQEVAQDQHLAEVRARVAELKAEKEAAQQELEKIQQEVVAMRVELEKLKQSSSTPTSTDTPAPTPQSSPSTSVPSVAESEEPQVDTGLFPAGLVTDPKPEPKPAKEETGEPKPPKKEEKPKVEPKKEEPEKETAPEVPLTGIEAQIKKYEERFDEDLEIKDIKDLLIRNLLTEDYGKRIQPDFQSLLATDDYHWETEESYGKGGNDSKKKRNLDWERFRLGNDGTSLNTVGRYLHDGIITDFEIIDTEKQGKQIQVNYDFGKPEQYILVQKFFEAITEYNHTEQKRIEELIEQGHIKEEHEKELKAMPGNWERTGDTITISAGDEGTEVEIQIKNSDDPDEATYHIGEVEFTELYPALIAAKFVAEAIEKFRTTDFDSIKDPKAPFAVNGSNKIIFEKKGTLGFGKNPEVLTSLPDSKDKSKDVQGFLTVPISDFKEITKIKNILNAQWQEVREIETQDDKPAKIDEPTDKVKNTFTAQIDRFKKRFDQKLNFSLSNHHNLVDKDGKFDARFLGLLQAPISFWTKKGSKELQTLSTDDLVDFGAGIVQGRFESIKPTKDGIEVQYKDGVKQIYKTLTEFIQDLDTPWEYKMIDQMLTESQWNLNQAQVDAIKKMPGTWRRDGDNILVYAGDKANKLFDTRVKVDFSKPKQPYLVQDYPFADLKTAIFFAKLASEMMEEFHDREADKKPFIRKSEEKLVFDQVWHDVGIKNEGWKPNDNAIKTVDDADSRAFLEANKGLLLLDGDRVEKILNERWNLMEKTRENVSGTLAKQIEKLEQKLFETGFEFTGINFKELGVVVEDNSKLDPNFVKLLGATEFLGSEKLNPEKIKNFARLLAEGAIESFDFEKGKLKLKLKHATEQTFNTASGFFEDIKNAHFWEHAMLDELEGDVLTKKEAEMLKELPTNLQWKREGDSFTITDRNHGYGSYIGDLFSMTIKKVSDKYDIEGFEYDTLKEAMLEAAMVADVLNFYGRLGTDGKGDAFYFNEDGNLMFRDKGLDDNVLSPSLRGYYIDNTKPTDKTVKLLNARWKEFKSTGE